MISHFIKVLKVTPTAMFPLPIPLLWGWGTLSLVSNAAEEMQQRNTLLQVDSVQEHYMGYSN